MIKIGQLQDWKMDESNGLFHGFFFLKFSDTAILNFYEKNYDIKSLPKRRSRQNSTTNNCFK